MINIQIEDPEEVLSKPEPALTAKEKYLELESYRHSFTTDEKYKLNGKDFNELIDSGAFNNSNDNHNFYLVNNLFNGTTRSQDELDAQKKIINNHDYSITNEQLLDHFKSAVNIGDFKHIKEMLDSQKVENLFLSERYAETLDSFSNGFEGEQASKLARQNRTNSPYQEIDDSRPYNYSLDVIAKASLYSSKENDVAEVITKRMPSVLDSLVKDRSYKDEQTEEKLAKLLSNENTFSNLGHDAKRNLLKTQTSKLENEINKDNSFPLVTTYIKYEEENKISNSFKKQLIDSAIENKCTNLLNDVARNTEYKFNDEQIGLMKGNESVFSEVLHNNKKKELHEKLTTTLAPKQKVKGLKI